MMYDLTVDMDTLRRISLDITKAVISKSLAIDNEWRRILADIELTGSARVKFAYYLQTMSYLPNTKIVNFYEDFEWGKGKLNFQNKIFEDIGIYHNSLVDIEELYTKFLYGEVFNIRSECAEDYFINYCINERITHVWIS